jgi:hypothetical protein
MDVPMCGDCYKWGIGLQGPSKLPVGNKLLQTLCFAFPARPTASNTFYCIPKTRQRRGTPRNAMVEEKIFWSNGFDDLKHPPPALFTHDPCTNPGPWGTPDAWACVGAEWMMCPETWEQPYKQWSPPSAVLSITAEIHIVMCGLYM